MRDWTFFPVFDLYDNFYKKKFLSAKAKTVPFCVPPPSRKRISRALRKKIHYSFMAVLNRYFVLDKKKSLDVVRTIMPGIKDVA